MDLIDRVIRLDTLLTGRQGEAERNARQQRFYLTDPISFVEHVSQNPYHLADGGYSRLLVDEDGNLSLDAISRAQVKARWADLDVQTAVKDLSDFLKRHLSNCR